MADRRGPLNYTTTIPAARTVGECQELLAAAGADAVAVMYSDRKPAGLSFRLSTPAGPRDFAMPVNIDGVQKMLMKANREKRLRSDGHRNATYETRDHASNVAWRVLKDWLEAQTAMIAAEMATLDEIMLPYLELGGGRTLYQAYLESDGLRALEAGDG